MPMYKQSLIILCCIALIASGITFYHLHNSTTDEIITNSATATTNDVITVYVSGEVNNPGIVELNSDSRVSDAIEACGGFTPLADKDKINLAQKTTDGMQIQVNIQNTTATDKQASNNSTNNLTTNNLININTATKEELDTLPGIGPATAQKILDYRQEQGNFQTLDDLKNVKGIGEAKFAKIQDKISL